jgi:hypothetical protein
MAVAAHFCQAEKIGAISMDHFNPDPRTSFHRESFSPLSARLILISLRNGQERSDPQQLFGERSIVVRPLIGQSSETPDKWLLRTDPRGPLCDQRVS